MGVERAVGAQLLADPWREVLVRIPLWDRGTRRLLVVGAAVSIAVSTAVVAAATGNPPAPPARPSEPVEAPTSTGHVGAPTQVQQVSSTGSAAPTKAERRARKAAMAGLATHLAPSLGSHTSTEDVQGGGGPPTLPGPAASN
jgi:hypothetical protein